MPRVTWAVLCSGFVAVVAQTLIIREALAIFSGNELVSGIILCFWLIWVGIGSLVFSSIKLRNDPLKIFSRLLWIICVLFVLSMCFIRMAHRVFALPFGEVIDLGRVVMISFLTLAPLCMVFGMLFPAASRVLQPEKVYLLEGFGAFVGGIGFSFLLINVLPPFGILLVSVVLLLSASFYIERRYWLFFIPLLLLSVFFRIDRMEFMLRRIQMKGQDLVALSESKYGAIAVTKSGDQYNVYTNGLYDFSYPDLLSSEEAVQYAMLLHGEPRRVLLIGGGPGGSINQVLKHSSIERVTYVELDPMLFEMGEEYSGTDLRNTEKLTVIFGDARHYIKKSTIRYDVIIVNLPDPVNVQINRFYTREFFAEAKNILQPGGLLSVRITAPPDIISPLFGQLLSTVQNTLNFSFDHIIALPVAGTMFIATDFVVQSNMIAKTLSARIEARGLDLTYVSPYYFDYDLSNEKLDYLNGRIAETRGYINSDLKPVCYYFASILWGGILSEPLRRGFAGLYGLSPVFFLIPLVAVFFFYRRRSLVYLSVLAVGASEISAELILIVLFQAFFGYLYGWVGAIIAFYMLGLAVGTFSYVKSSFLKRNAIARLAQVELLLAAYFLIVVMVALFEPPLVNIVIPGLVFCGGLMGGLHFPLSISALRKEKAGFVYGIDLVGSSIGALVTAMILIPILGIVFTLVVFCLLNLFVGFGLFTIRTG